MILPHEATPCLIIFGGTAFFSTAQLLASHRVYTCSCWSLVQT